LETPVPYDQEFLKVTWGFKLLTTDEIAQTSLNFSDSTSPTYDAFTALASIDIAVLGPLLITRMSTLMSTSALHWANYSTLNYVRVAGVLMSAAEIDPAKVYDDATPAQGTGTNVPPQCTLVASTRSGLSSGVANFGRMYLPHTLPALEGALPTTSAANTAAIAAAFATFVNGCNTDIQANDGTQTSEAMIMTQVTGGFSKKIAQVAVGNVIDTQRRRRNQLAETYAFATIP
jgi:alkaline phosphatase